MTTAIPTVFTLGWNDGAKAALAGVTTRTPRQVNAIHPKLTTTEIEVYLNGFEDGMKADTFRLHGAVPD